MFLHPCLAPNSSSWSSLASLTSRREAQACTVLGDEVWVMGGFLDDFKSGAFLSSTEVFSLSSLTWRPGPSLPSQVSWGQAFVAGGHLYHVGGIHSGGQVLRLQGQEWQEVATVQQTDEVKYSTAMVRRLCTVYSGEGYKSGFGSTGDGLPWGNCSMMRG